MVKALCLLVAAGWLIVPVFGQPRQWADDFSTVTTYDSNSLYAPCYGGASTKYTLVEVYTGDIYNERAVSGAGRLIGTSRSAIGFAGQGRYTATVVGVADAGQWCPDNPDPSPGASMITSEPFTSDNLCAYGGDIFSPWQLRLPPRGQYDIRGPDGQPGVAGVDDDLDGTKDEGNESPAARPTTVGGGYGNGPYGFPAGQDAAPGVAGVDDDANGLVDDAGETGWPGSDDGDDVNRQSWGIAVNSDFATSDAFFLNMDVGSGSNLFAFKEIVGGIILDVELGDEIHYGYYQSNVRYSWAFCVAGTCYGAQLWVGSDMINPVETLGPVLNTNHTRASANVVALIFGEKTQPVDMYMRQMTYLGNANFRDTFWVVSGSPAQCYPSPSSDLDGDKDVDGFDFLTFSNCYNGSNKPPLAACADSRADLDKDGDVDGFDFLTFSNCYNGSNRKPLAACFPPNLTACGL